MYVVPPPPQAAVPIRASSALFPVRRIWCIGRNYADHAREMGHDPDREPPFFFAKPADAVNSGGELAFPSATSDLHHEVELVVALGAGGNNIAVEAARELIFGYAVGLDMTRRDLQAEAKKLSRPWDLAKGFDQSCPISAIVPAREIGHPERGLIEARVNGVVQQSGDLAQMIWKVPEAISYLSRFVGLAAGDLIMTGTPAGVSSVRPGDMVQASCEGLGEVVVQYGNI